MAANDDDDLKSLIKVKITKTAAKKIKKEESKNWTSLKRSLQQSNVR
jgi:hypothetical protein